MWRLWDGGRVVLSVADVFALVAFSGLVLAALGTILEVLHL